MVLAMIQLGAGCGGDSASSAPSAPDGGGAIDGALSDADAPAPDGSSPSSRADAGSDAAHADGATDAASTADAAAVADPNADGPYPYAEKDATTLVAATGDNVALHVAYPTGAGSFPVVLLGHGFQLPPSQYYGYLKRLASFGYVALTVDYPAAFSGPNNPNEAKDLIAGIDWAKADTTFGANVDGTIVGTTGHSLGGKVALLAATLDARVKASIALDPVDGGGGPSGCTPPACVTVANLLPSLHVPTGFLGETTDATGSFQACAPAASNYTTFYAKANAPSLQVTVTGANHVSFLDDVSTCGTTCSFCKAATAPNAQVNGTARAFVVAFFERYLRGNSAYDAYLTGSAAQARYVATSQAVIVSK